jgi:hypothetical protein
MQAEQRVRDLQSNTKFSRAISEALASFEAARKAEKEGIIKGRIGMPVEVSPTSVTSPKPKGMRSPIQGVAPGPATTPGMAKSPWAVLGAGVKLMSSTTKSAMDDPSQPVVSPP